MSFQNIMSFTFTAFMAVAVGVFMAVAVGMFILTRPSFPTAGINTASISTMDIVVSVA